MLGAGTQDASCAALKTAAGSTTQAQQQAFTASLAVDQTNLVMVMTDVCLKTLPKELLPLGASLLIQYDMPVCPHYITSDHIACTGQCMLYPHAPNLHSQLARRANFSRAIEHVIRAACCCWW